MAHTARALALFLAATTAALGAVSVAAAGAAPSSPLTSPSRVAAHEVVAPAPVAVAAPATKPKAKARVVAPAKPKAAPRQVKAAAPRPKAAPVVRKPSLTPAQLMQRAINRLPDVRPGDVVFILKPGLDSWGLAELHGTVWISPRVPAKRMYDVVAHEWSHVLSAKAYDDVNSAVAAMNAYFGGSGITGAERAADCMARLLGATWTHYTSCSDSRWRAGAKRLLNRQQL